MQHEHAFARVATAWGGYGLTRYLDLIGIHAWSDFAGMAAGLYSICLIGDWLWKKFKAWRESA